METSTRWSEEDDKVLITYIQENPDNLVSAFKRTAFATGKTVSAVQNRWYGILKHRTEIFLLKSDKAENINTKNVLRKTSIEDMSASDLCKLLILKLETKKVCLENMIDNIKTFLTYKEKL